MIERIIKKEECSVALVYERWLHKKLKDPMFVSRDKILRSHDLEASARTLADNSWNNIKGVSMKRKL